jgi:hypothetical protein
MDEALPDFCRIIRQGREGVQRGAFSSFGRLRMRKWPNPHAEFVEA